MKLEKDARISHYKILSSIGKGGMGEVFLAQDSKLDRKVALKILPAEFAADTDRMHRFVREAQSASALNHPNIITIYEIGEFEGTHFIAAEFIDGKTLSDYVKADPLNYKSALEIAVQVASALDEAHQAGIVHRDIKPDNVMIRSNGLAKILDFGIAKLAEKQTIEIDAEDATAIQKPSTSPGMIIGTANYMSPEQAKGEAVDARTDIFSFGVVLYEMLAGHLPFEGKTPMEIIGAVIHKEPLPFDANIPHEIAEIINKCLRKDRRERYQMIKDALNDLKEIKLELDVQDKLERTIQPNKDEQKTQMLKAAATADESSQTATAETRNDSITIRKSSFNKLAAGVLTILLMSAIGLGYWFYSKSNAKQINSIAVMPFVNESGNADAEYLSDGMTETLIKSLSQLPNLNVKPRSSVFRYKGKDTDLQTIAKELNVQAVLNGRVVQRGDQITLSLELIDVQKDSVIWTEQYQRKASDLVSLQSEIAKDVSDNLKAKLSGAETAKVTRGYTDNSEAYQLYLKGRYHWNKRTYEDLTKAVDNFKAAIEKDDHFALAYSGLADTYSVLQYYQGSRSNEFINKAMPYAVRSVELDDQLAEAHSSLAFVNEGSWKWTDAEKEYRRALELNPNYSSALLRFARFEARVPKRDAEALIRIKRAVEIEPSSAVISDNLSQMYLSQGNAALALEQAKKTVELDPNFSFGWIDLAYSQLKNGQTAEALTSAEKVVEITKRSSRSLVCLGFVYAASERLEESTAILKELEKRYENRQADAVDVAALFAGLGNKDQCFIWLDKAFADHSSLLVDLRAEYPFAGLLDDQHYKDLRKRLNLPE